MSPEFPKALKVGRAIQKHRYSGAFEIMALAHYENGQLDKAIQVLREGVRKTPRVWLLWQQLGNYLSDKNRHRDAQRAYQQALKCPGTDEASVQLNIAIDLSRTGHGAKALKLCDSLSDSPLRLKALALKTQLLVERRQFDQAITLAERLIEESGRKAKRAADVTEDLSRVYVCLAEAQWRRKTEKAVIVSNLKKALELHRLNKETLWLLREVNGELSAKSQYFRLMVEGRWDGPLEGKRGTPGFFTTYDVVAEDRDEALRFVKEIERAGIRDSLAVAECKALEKRPREPKGVYRVTGFCLYPTRK